MLGKFLFKLWIFLAALITITGYVGKIAKSCTKSAEKTTTVTEMPKETPVPTKAAEPTAVPEVTDSLLTLNVYGREYPIPDYSGRAYAKVNGDKPFFNDADKKCTEPIEEYPELDPLGRCGSTLANICKELMPEDDREEIGIVRPSGWHTVKYPDLIEDLYLFNRCHLIGFQLAGENANEKNLITGTRYLNIDGMLDHENLIARYVRKTGNHVMFRVTPVFVDDELVCRGVLMEGWSVEDDGDGICFCIFAYNVQPGISIDYATGDSQRETEGTYEVTPATCSVNLLKAD